MGKMQRRKGAAALDKAAQPVVLLTDNPILKGAACVAQFVESINNCASLTEQLKVCQLLRGTVKVQIASMVASNTAADVAANEALFRSLMHIFLHPSLYALRKSLEWVLDLVVRKHSSSLVNAASLQRILRDAADRCMGQFHSEVHLDKATQSAEAEQCIRACSRDGGTSGVPTDLEFFLEWIIVFGNVTNTERELPWFHTCEEAAGDYLFKFLQHISALVSHIGALLKASATLTGSSSSTAPSSSSSTATTTSSSTSSVGALLDAFEEAVRLIPSAIKVKRTDMLKQAKVQALSVGGAAFCAELPATVDQLVALSMLPFVAQNATNGVTLAVVSLQWLRNVCLCSSVDTTERVAVQQEALWKALVANCPSSGAAPSSGEGREAEWSYSLLRAHLSVVDDEVFQSLCYSDTRMHGRERTGDARSFPRDTVLLDETLRVVVSVMCDNANINLCLLALQTLETLCSRIQCLVTSLDVSTTASDCDSANCALPGVSKVWSAWYLPISAMLTRHWASSTKQINHLVPSVYERMIQITESIPRGASQPSAQGLGTWRALLSQALSQPANYRGRYQALSVLFSKMPVESLRALLTPSGNVSRSPTAGNEAGVGMVSALVEAVKIRDISSASCSCLCALLLKLRPDGVGASASKGGNAKETGRDVEKGGGERRAMQLEQFRALWVPPLVDALCGSTGVADAASDVGSESAAVIGSAAEVLTGRHSRINIAEYLVPEITRLVDSTCITVIINTIRAHGSLTVHQKLWGLCQVVMHARGMGLDGGELLGDDGEEADKEGAANSTLNSVILAEATLAPSGLLRTSELRYAFISDDIDLKLAGLTLLVLSSKAIAPVPTTEFALFRYGFQFVVKCPLPDHRHKVCRIVRNFLTRLKECTRSTSRDIALLRIKMDKRQELLLAADAAADVASDEVLAQDQAAITALQGVFDDNLGFCQWLSEEILQHLQPGCTYDRQLMVMELLNNVISSLQYIPPQQAQAMHQEQLRQQGGTDATMTGVQVSAASLQSYTAAEALQECFYSPDMVLAVLRYCVSSWDRCRHAAADLLLKFPVPLPGIGGAIAGVCSDEDNAQQSMLDALLQWGYSLSNSVRQRESDSGSYILRDVFHIYCLKLGRAIAPAQVSPAIVPAGDVATNVSSLMPTAPGKDPAALYNANCTRFFDNMCDELDRRLDVLVALYSHIISSGSLQAHSAPAPSSTGTSTSTAGGEQSASTTGATLVPQEGAGSPSSPWTFSQQEQQEYMCHGLIQTLLHCVNEIIRLDSVNAAAAHLRVQRGDTVGADAVVREWSGVVHRLHSLMLKAFNTALMIVAEATVDAYFAPIFADSAAENNEAVKEEVKNKGPVHANSFMFVNTNGFMGATGSGAGEDEDAEGGGSMDDDEGDDDDDAEGAKRIGGRSKEESMIIQKAVVSAWLLAKASVSVLVRLVEVLPSLPMQQLNGSAEAGGVVVHSCHHNITFIGHLLVDALSRLRHLGAILEVQVSLQRVCELVLTHRSSAASEMSPSSGVALWQLPRLWLDRLIERLTSERQVFILRRSAGFAYSFLSILRAEGPTSTRSSSVAVASGGEGEKSATGESSVATAGSLLQHTMVVLLRLANAELNVRSTEEIAAGAGVAVADSSSSAEDDDNSWRRCVHAINILRLILLDGTLTGGTDPFLSQCAKLAISGFRSSRWGIRNSAMMLFTAVVQKSVDNEKNESKNIIARRTATCTGYFQKYPDLFPFMLSELRYATADVDRLGDRQGENLRDEFRQMSLYPILLLLAKLKPTFSAAPVGDDGGAQHRNVDEFICLSQKCFKAPQHKIRQISAHAMVTLLPVQFIPRKITELCNIHIVQNCDSSTPNELHGVMLTILALTESLLKHKTHFQLIYSAENRILLERIDEEMMKSSIPAFLAVVDKEIIAPFIHDFAILPPGIILAYLRVLYSMKSLGYAVEGDSLHCLLMMRCFQIIRGIAKSGPGGDYCSLNPGNPAFLPHVPLLYQCALEYSVADACLGASDRLGVSHGAPQADAATFSRLYQDTICSLLAQGMPLAAAPGLTPTIVEVQLGILIGMHTALDNGGEMMAAGGDRQESFLHRIVSSIVQVLVSTSSHFTERVLECALTLLCRLLARDSFRATVAPALMQHRELLWTYFHSLIVLNADNSQSRIDLASSSNGAYALELLGWILRLARERNSISNPLWMQHEEQWCAIIEVACSEEQPFQQRVFCCRSIRHSNYLRSPTAAVPASGSDGTAGCKGGVMFRLWTVLLILLQDDDVDVRSLARVVAAAASTGVSCPLTTGSSMGDDDEDEDVAAHRFLSYTTTHATSASDSVRSLTRHHIDAQKTQPQSGSTSPSTGDTCLQTTLEFIMTRITRPLSESLHGSMSAEDGIGALQKWWDFWLRNLLKGGYPAMLKSPAITKLCARRETQVQILRQRRDGGPAVEISSAAPGSFKIFTAEPLNSHFEVLATIDAWVHILVTALRKGSLLEPSVGQFLTAVVVPSLEQSFTLLEQLITPIDAAGGGAGCGASLSDNVLAYNEDIYAYIYGNIVLLKELRVIMELPTCNGELADSVGAAQGRLLGVLHAANVKTSSKPPSTEMFATIHPKLRGLLLFLMK